jgi:hypothetical protein
VPSISIASTSQPGKKTGSAETVTESVVSPLSIDQEKALSITHLDFTPPLGTKVAEEPKNGVNLRLGHLYLLHLIGIALSIIQ